MRTVATCAVLLLMLAGCAPVQPWQRMYVDHPEMGGRTDGLAREMEAYREGASGTSTDQSGGGCGCY